MYEHILIPTDGQDETIDAVQPGFELASQHGATVHILHVVENDLLSRTVAPRSMRSLATDARQHGEEAVAKLETIAEERGVESVTWVLRAQPALGRRRAHETIVEYAETNDVDLIVMGATDRGRLSTLLRPSITHRVMASTDVPVHGRRLSRQTQYADERSSRPGAGSELGD